MNKKLITILIIFTISQILNGKNYSTKFILGKGEFIHEATTSDNRYILEVFEYSITIYFTSENKKIFLNIINTDKKIKKVLYKSHNLFIELDNETIKYDIKSDDIKKEDDKDKQALKITREKNNEFEDYYIAITQNGIKIGQKVIILEDEPIAYLYHTNKKIEVKGEKKEIKENEKKLIMTILSELKPEREVIENKYIKTKTGILVFYPTFDEFFKLLEKYKNKTHDEKTLEVLKEIYNEKDIISLLIKKKIENNNKEDIEEIIKKYYSLFKKDNEINTLLGEFYYNRNDYKNAQKYIKEVNTPYSKFILANICVIENKIQDAEKNYKIAISMDKTFYKAYNNLASLYINKKKYNEAEKLLIEGIKNNSENHSLYYNLGLLYEKIDKLPIAILLYEKANSLAKKTEKDYPKKEIIDSLYYSYIKMGKIDDAEDLLKDILKKEPNDPISHYNLGYLYEIKKDKKKAIFHYNIFLETNRDEKNKNLENLVRKRIKKLVSEIENWHYFLSSQCLKSSFNHFKHHLLLLMLYKHI